jgi:tetratricopeptide (TPR) repeat protein
MLLEHARKYNLPLWAEVGARLRSVVDLKGGNFNADLRLPPVGHNGTHPRNFNFLILLGELVQALSHAGRTAEALGLLDQRLDLSKADWLTPELFRLKAELSPAQGMPAAIGTAEQLLRHAGDEARRHAALSWELRAASSLAGLLQGQGRSAEAIACLQTVYDRFTEGFGTADLVAAKRLLDDLGGTRHH